MVIHSRSIMEKVNLIICGKTGFSIISEKIVPISVQGRTFQIKMSFIRHSCFRTKSACLYQGSADQFVTRHLAAQN